VHRQRIQVAFEYPVHFTRDVFAPDNPVLADAISEREPHRRHRLYVTVDSGVVEAWPGLCDRIVRYCGAHARQVDLAARPRIVEGGERSKQSPELIDELQADMRRLAIDRQSFALTVGGGAVLDAVGYAAATTHRGVRIVRLPTTVLAQGDGGVGVKNGINAFGAKNFFGTFAPPFAVINDLDFLTTLEGRDVRAGMAEAVKVGLIRDAPFFEWIWTERERLGAREPGAVEELVRRAAEIHMDHIATSGDPFELGSARPLDFGHWAAHKLESLSRHALRHGEAVAIGMALDSRYSVEAGLLAESDLGRICALLDALGLDLWHEALERGDSDGKPSVLSGLREFREHLGGELTVTLLCGVGRKVEVHAIDEARVIRAIDWLRARAHETQR
jgi:3-dehydroquinate synthase